MYQLFLFIGSLSVSLSTARSLADTKEISPHFPSGSASLSFLQFQISISLLNLLSLVFCLEMASVQATAILISSAVTKNGNTTACLPLGFVISRAACKKEFCAHSMASGARATLTFDPPTRTNQKKHTVDPSSPDFLPLPSFEQCFPKSTKEYR